MKKLMWLVLLVGMVSGQGNYTGFMYWITGFKADSLKSTPVFEISPFENLGVSVGWDDLDAVRFANDSVKFYYYLKIGWPTQDSGGVIDTFWLPTNYGIDTLKDTVGYWGVKASMMDSTCVLVDRMGGIDTLSVRGLCTSGHTISCPWGAFGQLWVKGLTGNNVGSNLRFRFGVARRNGLSLK